MNSRLQERLTEVATEIDYLKSLRRDIVKNVYQKRMKMLVKKRDILLEDLQQARRSLEISRQMNIAEAKRKKKREEALKKKKDNALRKRVNVIFNRIVGEDVYSDIIDAWRASDTFGTLRAITPGYDFELMHTAQSKDFIRQFFVRGSDGDMKVEPGERLLIVAPTNITADRMRQLFRDGISHCVFTPLLAKLDNALSNTESKDRKTRLRQKIAKLNEMCKKYDLGVPVDDMELVAKASGFKIIIHDVLGSDIFTFNEAGKCGIVRFTNTRPNHIEEGKIVMDCDSKILSKDDMMKKWNQLDKDGVFYMIEGDLKDGEPRKIRSIEGVYETQDPNKDYFNEMNELIDIHKCRFNASKYPEVNEFIKAGRIINAWVTPFTDLKPTGHIDMPKAYTQFKKCEWYSGFMGTVHQWRDGNFDRKWLDEHIGIYQVRMKTDNPLFKKLGLGRKGFFGNEATVHILPSPEILYFMDKGVECEIFRGAWGSRMDFEFPDYMLEDRRYALWSGRLSMEHHQKKYTFKCSQEWASHIKADYGDDCFYWEDKGLCSVKTPIKNVYTTHHILAFITSYVRIQMMEALMKFDVDKIVKVVLDGIYYVGDKPECLDWFREKEIVDHKYSGFAWYSDELFNVSWNDCWISKNTLLTGQGGAGKTYKVMTDKCFNKILFVTPQHTLGGNITDTYGVSYTTIHRLIGEGCEPYLHTHQYPPVIFVDEITQIESSWIDKVFSMYKNSLIILAGDVNQKGQWFQCRNGKPGEFSTMWKPTGVDVICVEGDRRSKDDELRNLKIHLRKIMEKCFVNGDEGEEMVMKMYAKRYLQLTSFDDAVKMFSPGDCWIAGTHKTSNKLLENGVVSGWYKQGGYVKFEETEGHTKRGSFTIHSFQGRTIDQGKIFISVNDLFEYAMLYTAISRAVHFNQLVFVI